MTINGHNICINPHKSGLALKRGNIIVYSIVDAVHGDLHINRNGEWSDKQLLMCDCFAACELDEFLRRYANKDDG